MACPYMPNFMIDSASLIFALARQQRGPAFYRDSSINRRYRGSRARGGYNLLGAEDNVIM
jgi:hypothetical protein